MAKKKTTVTTVTTTTTTITGSTPRKIYDGFVIDRSGSMSSIWTSTINGANEYINTAKRDAQENEVKSYFSLLWFDDRHDFQYKGANVISVNPLNKTEFAPRGSTALNDAIAKMINHLKEIVGNHPSPDTDVTLTIFTDGDENASVEFPNNSGFDHYGRTNAAIKAMIDDVQNRLKWTVVYVGAGLKKDVQYVASNLGVTLSNVASYIHEGAATSDMFMNLTSARSMKTKSFMAGGQSCNTGYFDNTPKAADPNDITLTGDLGTDSTKNP